MQAASPERDEEDTTPMEQDFVIPNRVSGKNEPTQLIAFTDTELQYLYKPWKQTLIIQTVGYSRIIPHV